MRCVEHMDLFLTMQVLLSVISSSASLVGTCLGQTPTLPPTLGDRALFPVMFTLQKHNSPALRKDIVWAVKLATDWEKSDIISKGGRERICNYKFSKVHV